MDFETEIVSRGNSYGFAIPKALVRCNVLKQGQKYRIIVEEAEPVPMDLIEKKKRRD